MAECLLVQHLIYHGPINHNFNKTRFIEIWKLVCGCEDDLSYGLERRTTLEQIMNVEEEHCDLIELQDILTSIIASFLEKPSRSQIKECMRAIKDVCVTIDIPQSQTWRNPIICFHESLSTYINKSKHVFIEMVPSSRSDGWMLTQEGLDMSEDNSSKLKKKQISEEVCKNYIETDEIWGTSDNNNAECMTPPILCFYCEDGIYENVRISIDDGKGDCTALIQEYMLDVSNDSLFSIKHGIESITNKDEMWSDSVSKSIRARNQHFDVPICKITDKREEKKKMYNTKLHMYYTQDNEKEEIFCHYALIDIYNLKQRFIDIKKHVHDDNCVKELEFLIHLCDVELPERHVHKKKKCC